MSEKTSRESVRETQSLKAVVNGCPDFLYSLAENGRVVWCFQLAQFDDLDEAASYASAYAGRARK